MKIISRRAFTKTTGFIAAFAPFFAACKNLFKQNITNSFALTNAEYVILSAVHLHLFPDSKGVPGATFIQSAAYVQKLMTDPQIDTGEKRLIKSGIKWINDTALELHGIGFIDANKEQKESSLKDLSEYTKGNRWISRNITFILEALLADPIYNVNTAQSGWKWLNHSPGYPRPTKATKYQFL
jgi:gluconate 2-dehydrogenase gamma chain